MTMPHPESAHVPSVPWPAAVPRAWLLPNGMQSMGSKPCLAIEGRPGTVVAQSMNAFDSFSLDALPRDAKPLVAMEASPQTPSGPAPDQPGDRHDA